MTGIYRTVELYPKQFDFVVSQARRVAFIGGIGSGKTLGGCIKALTQSDEPDGVGLVTAPTYPMLRDVTWRTMIDLAGDNIADVVRSEMLLRLRTGFEMMFRSADNPDRLRGPNVSWFFMDEGALCSDMAWRIGVGRCRRGGKARSAWLTTTPKGRNWVWERFERNRKAHYVKFGVRTEDNPYLDPQFVEDLKSEYVGDFARQELGGEFVAFEGLVYDEFSRDIHIWRSPLPMFTRVIAGVDWGYTNPATVVVIGLDGDDRAYVVDEFYARRITLQEHIAYARELMDRWGIMTFICDPSEPEHIAEFRTAGLDAVGGDNAVTPGIQAVKARLAVLGDGKPRLYFTPAVPNTMAEFDAYVWRKHRDIGLLDAPEKTNDHALDALRYGIMWVDHAPTVKFSFVDW